MTNFLPNQLLNYWRNSAYYPGCGDDFTVMFHNSSPTKWVFNDWGGPEEEGYIRMATGDDERSFSQMRICKEFGYKRSKVVDVTSLFKDVIGLPATKFGNKEEDVSGQKVLYSLFTHQEDKSTKEALFFLGYEGVMLYTKLYRKGRPCSLFLVKQGLGTKYSQNDPNLYDNLKNAFSANPPKQVWTADISEKLWRDIFAEVKVIRRGDPISLVSPGKCGDPDRTTVMDKWCLDDDEIIPDLSYASTNANLP